MKKILLALAVTAMVASSCGMKSNAQGEDAKDKATVEATAEETATEVEADKDSTAVDCTAVEKSACCEKDSTASEACTEAEKKACCDKETKDTEGENTEE
ncbi:hypothetical protein [Carboxylicivirga taeanensis]|uniref:hypothetical protein n=1 Tax=Carboxylicivirga taeanensis TaxID=1416875 RepID=UPI003F6E1A53